MTSFDQPVLSKTDSRNYGLDVLKFISMVYVIILHTIEKGIVPNTSTGEHRLILFFLYIWSSCGVNIFALITGYVSYSDTPKRFNCKRIFDMWLQVVFYGLLITTIFFFILPDKVNIYDFLNSGFPIFSNEYWYYTAYFLVYLFSPLINSAVRALSTSTLTKFFIVILFFFSFFSVFSYSQAIVQAPTFTWILILYILGAIIRKCKIGEKLSPHYLITGGIICNLISLVWLVSDINVTILRSVWNNYTLCIYISPTMVIPAICHLLLFKKMKAGNNLQKVVTFLSPCIFSSYLINTHPIIYTKVLGSSLAFLSKLNAIWLPLVVILFSVIFVLCSCLIDKLRMRIFIVVGLDKLAMHLANITDKVMNCIIKSV